MGNQNSQDQVASSEPGHACSPLLIALGASCQCTYQVRRFTGIERAFYFDWLGTTHIALLTVLQLRFKGLFRRENLVLAREGTTVMDSLTGVSYRHAFRWQRGSKLIDPASLEHDYAAQREKFAFLTERWLQDLQSRSILFVRQDSPTPEQARELALALALYCAQSFQLLFVTADFASARRLDGAHPAVLGDALEAEESPNTGWQGVNAAWDRLLNAHTAIYPSSSLRPIVARELAPHELALT